MQIYKNISDDFLDFDLKSFFEMNSDADINEVLLRNRSKYKFDFSLVTEQLEIYPRAKHKLPSFVNCWCYFTRKSYEQSSSEIVAKYKATLFPGKSMLDLTGGLGVDDWAFSKNFDEVISIDKDVELNKLVRKNFGKLKAHNIQRIDGDAYDFIKKEQHYDLIFIDADRRPQSAEKRISSLSQSEPDILRLKQRLLEIGEIILLKLSPMLDLTAIIKELEDVNEIYIVSNKNEVKEILVVLSKPKTKIIVHAVELNENTIQTFEGGRGDSAPVDFYDDGNYFYEPALSLIKSGLVPDYASKSGVRMLSKESVYLVSDQEVPGFFGRKFEIISRIKFGKSTVKKYMKESGITAANISKRNFPAQVVELRKMLGLKDGGSEYLFFTQNSSKDKLMFHCRKIS